MLVTRCGQAHRVYHPVSYLEALSCRLARRLVRASMAEPSLHSCRLCCCRPMGCVPCRHFGGIKLGAGGLARAYGVPPADLALLLLLLLLCLDRAGLLAQKQQLQPSGCLSEG